MSNSAGKGSKPRKYSKRIYDSNYSCINWKSHWKSKKNNDGQLIGQENSLKELKK